MGVPQEQKFDAIQFKQDRQAYLYWFSRQFGAADDEDAAQKVSDVIYAAVRFELSETQRRYFTEYYFEGLTMDEIADIHGVNKSSISRTITRAKERMKRVLKYVDPNLFRLFEKKRDGTRGRYNKAGIQKYKCARK